MKLRKKANDANTNFFFAGKRSLTGRILALLLLFLILKVKCHKLNVAKDKLKL